MEITGHTARKWVFIIGAAVVVIAAGIGGYGLLVGTKAPASPGDTQTGDTRSLQEVQADLATEHRLLFYGVTSSTIAARQDLPLELAFLIPANSTNIIVQKVLREADQKGFIAAYRQDVSLAAGYADLLATFEKGTRWEVVVKSPQRLAALIEARNGDYEVRVNLSSADGKEDAMYLATVEVNVL